MKLDLPEGADLQMGHIPRAKYPLVVVLLNADGIHEEPNDLCVVSDIAILLSFYA